MHLGCVACMLGAGACFPLENISCRYLQCMEQPQVWGQACPQSPTSCTRRLSSTLFPFQPALGRAPHLWWQRSRSCPCSAPAVPVGREPEVALCAGPQNAARNQWGKTGSVALEAAGKKQWMFLRFYRIDLKAGFGQSFLCLSRKGCDFSRISFI